MCDECSRWKLCEVSQRVVFASVFVSRGAQAVSPSARTNKRFALPARNAHRTLHRRTVAPTVRRANLSYCAYFSKFRGDIPASHRRRRRRRQRRGLAHRRTQRARAARCDASPAPSRVHDVSSNLICMCTAKPARIC